MPDRIGQHIGGYLLIRLLGEGSFAQVYLGESIDQKTQVAVKVLKSQFIGNEKLHILDLLKEVRTIRLKHPHIVPILDFNVENDTLFIIMEYASNGTLRQRHPKGTQIPLPTIVSYVKQVASALQYAHDERLIHRDVKPENILIGAQNQILLSDFGIATIAHSTASQRVETMAGTIPYMAPEQIQGHPRPASDQYSLGVVVYEWLCGSRPFHGTQSEIAIQHAVTPPPPLREKVPTLPSEVEQVVLTALAKDPKQRFESVQDFSNALAQVYEAELPTEMPSALEQTIVVSAPPSSPVNNSNGTILNTYRGHFGIVNAVAWSPDGTLIASGGSDYSVQVWDVITGQEVFSRHNTHRQVNAVAWSPDGTLIASAGSEGTVHVWDFRKEYKVSTNHGPLTSINQGTPWSIWTIMSGVATSKPSVSVNALAWSPDGKYIAAASSDNNVYVWEATHKCDKPILTFKEHSGKVVAVSWSSDGKYIASGDSERTVYVWDAMTGDEILPYHNHSGSVVGVQWLPNTQCIVSVGEGEKTIEIWSGTSGKVIRVYRGHNQWYKALACSSDGKYIASGDSNKTVHIWDANTGLGVFTQDSHSGLVNALAWSPDKMCIASAGSDKTVQIWRVI